MSATGRRGIAEGLAVAALAVAAGLTVSADQIRLKDGKDIDGTILQKDGDDVIVRLPRASVEAVNGKLLPPPVTAGAVAPEFTAVDFAGAPQNLAGYRGHVTLLQFWASWCPHCRADLPLLKELATQYKDKGLRMLTVSIDQKLDDLQQFLVREQVPYPVISTLSQPTLPDLYESQGVPGYFLIDGKGKIVKVWRGSLSEGSATGKAELRDLLAQLLPSDESAASAKPVEPLSTVKPATPAASTLDTKSHRLAKHSKTS